MRKAVAAVANGVRRHGARVSRCYVAAEHYPLSASDTRRCSALCRPFSTTGTRGIRELAAALDAKETSTEERVAAVNSITLPSAADGSALARSQQALELVESGVLASLTELLRDSDAIAESALLVPAFLALIRLAPEPLVAQELARLGTPAVFARFLRSEDPRLQAAACLALGTVALEPAAADAVASDSVASAVLHTLASPHEPIRRAAATCLADIAGSARGRNLLCNAETLSLLVELLLQDDASDSMLSATAFALGNILAGHDIGAQDILRETGGLAQLVLLLSPAFPEETSGSAAWAIHHGARLNHASQSLVAAAGGLALLAQHLTAATEALQTNALLALDSAISGHQENLDWCRAAGSGEALIEALKRVQRDEGDELNASAKHALESLLEQLA